MTEEEVQGTTGPLSFYFKTLNEEKKNFFIDNLINTLREIYFSSDSQYVRNRIVAYYF